METPKEYYYTYYSYEEWGRGYFGSRKCYCLPEEDVKYLGSSKDKTFKPTQKIILKGDYKTHQEAVQDEIFLHDYFEVDINPHFANRAKQRSTKFSLTSEKASEYGKKAKELGVGIHALTKEQRLENNKKYSHIGGKKCYENKSGMFKLTREERVKLGKRNYESGIGLGSLTKEQRTEMGKKGSKNTNSQRWECTVTGFVTNSGALTSYQKKRSIDTSKRRRIS
jgi:hypothetical protein